MDYPALRKQMVEEQLIPRGIQDKRVLQTFLKVERHRFVPAEAREKAYGDYPLPIGEKQTISQPYMVALMTECLQLRGTERILEIGTGSGYQSAILAELAKEVYTIERHALLAEPAHRLLREMGYKNISFKVGDGTLGWPEQAPFDRIIITAATAEVPDPLSKQLTDDGLIVAPIGELFSQTLTVFHKDHGQLRGESFTSCVFVPLIGKFGLQH
ncbi:MAG TPA: protein-L-isoaspartate(D-aspartate) O-methyltransferase [Candidatus Omnitrophota bacterium]|nr:protein-L-isoaspartate(D-aspartate) O-methyltransferase [Candidatus Omnitrophota bacterium]HRZ14804.1 protein-L-isoaspartate(D-aspartate) O-methyltransferase [Candidatus Omnitrophota bacterium]